MARGFTVVSIKSKKDGSHADPGCLGLYLRVRGPSRVWQMRYTFEKKPGIIFLGSTARVGLAEARDKVADARALIRQGINPKNAPRPVLAAPSTFQEDALTYHEYAKAHWSPLHTKYWWQSMAKYVFPTLGSMDTAKVTVEDILAILKPIWANQNGSAIRLHGRIKATIEHAIETDDHSRFNGNPADRVLKRLPRIKREQTPHAAIDWRKAPELYRKLGEIPDQSAIALRFLILLGCPRASEVIKASWSEIEGDVFHVPANRVKSRKAIDRPLTQAALDLLTGLGPREGYIFPGRRGKLVNGEFKKFSGHAHEDSMQLLLRDMGVHVHGLRSTVRSWVQQNAVHVSDREAIEINLDHKVYGRIEGVYAREDLLDERRQLLERWSRFLLGG